jgi:hypothetical protein
MLKWLSNTYDPARPESKTRVIGDPTEHAFWLEGKIIGDPVPTEWFTVAELRAMHMVGVYVEVEDAPAEASE